MKNYVLTQTQVFKYIYIMRKTTFTINLIKKIYTHWYDQLLLISKK